VQRLTRSMAKYIVAMLGDSTRTMSGYAMLRVFSPRGRKVLVKYWIL
jgi:hypothetical protein